MRKIAAACVPLLALVVLVASSQAKPAAQDDGCLVVQAGRGIVSFNAKGFLLGRFDQGNVEIEDRFPATAMFASSASRRSAC